LIWMSPLVAYADWMLVTRAADGTEFHIDDKTIEVKGSNRRASVLILKAQSSADRVRGTIILNDFDCETRRYRMLSLREFDSAGTTINSLENPSEWMEIDDASVGKTIINAACDSQSITSAEQDRRQREYEAEERRREEQEAQRERSLQQAEYGFCIAECSSKPGATLLVCMARCARYAPR
jgi:hypothetical protein